MLQAIDDITSFGMEVRSFRARFYINFRSTQIQRWAATKTKTQEYYTLNPIFWRGATDEKVSPPQAIKLAGGGQTMYFETEEEAYKIGQRFLEGLIKKGVL